MDKRTRIVTLPILFPK